MKIEKLDKSRHDRTTFDCGVAPLNNYLKNYSGQHDKHHLSRTYVLLDEQQSQRTLGFYSLAMTNVNLENLPIKLMKRSPKGANCALLARLAVDLTYTGQGLGGILLIDAIKRAYLASLSVPVPMIVVDAKDQGAAEFYRHFGFKSLPDMPLKLINPMKHMHQLLQSAGLL